MGGLTLYISPRHNSLIRPTDKLYFICKLAIVKYFDKILQALQSKKITVSLYLNLFTLKILNI